MKFAITGSHGVGKTSLLNNLMETLRLEKEVILLNEIPREIIDLVDDSDFFKKAENTLLKQMLIFLGQFTKESIANEDGKIFLCDRTILDHWAYTYSVNSNLFTSEIKLVFNKYLKDYINKTFTHIFFLPIEFDLEIDDVRDKDIEFQYEISELIKNKLIELKVPFSIVSGTISERSDVIEKIIYEMII